MRIGSKVLTDDEIAAFVEDMAADTCPFCKCELLTNLIGDRPAWSCPNERCPERKNDTPFLIVPDDAVLDALTEFKFGVSLIRNKAYMVRDITAELDSQEELTSEVIRDILRKHFELTKEDYERYA